MTHHLMPRLRRAFATMLTVIGIFAYAGTAGAANTTYAEDTTLNMSGIGVNLVILAGSESDALSVNATTFTLTVAAGDTFTIMWPSPNPGKFVNADGVDDCNIVGGNNQVAIAGPKTTTITPTASPVCASGGGGSSLITPQPASVIVGSPNGGEVITAGSSFNIQYVVGGTDVNGVRLSLSYDGGATFPTIIADRAVGINSYLWVVPSSIAGTTHAIIKAEAIDINGIALASDVANTEFTIASAAPGSSGGGGGGGGGTIPPTNPPAQGGLTSDMATGLYDPDTARNNAFNIDHDKSITHPVGLVPLCTAGSLIKGSLSATYYCGANGKRFVFPNEKVYKSWYADFSSVITIPDAILSQIMLGGNITYRPGTRMVKIQTDPKVYAVAKGGELRPIDNESVARALYGTLWNQIIDDVSDALFVNYRLGDPIHSSDVLNPKQ